MKIEILENQAAVAQRAADLLLELCRAKADAHSADGFVNVALSGGTTPKALYKILTAPPYKDAMPWDKIRWFVGDERTVPIDHQDSNFHMARENLFKPLGVSEDLQFPVPNVGVAPPLQVASDYETDILQWVKSRGEEGLPVFDVILLGVGSDGHTASLFPHTKALDESPGKIVVANYVDKLQTWRITLTADVIRNAANVLVLVTGEDKAQAMSHVLDGPPDYPQYPAQLARDLHSATWLVDAAAASHLKK